MNEPTAANPGKLTQTTVVYSLYGGDKKRIITESVSGEIGPVLQHISRKIRQHGSDEVYLRVRGLRLSRLDEVNKPKMVGTIGALIKSKMKVNGKPGYFDGTTKDLTLKALEMGAKHGTIIDADYGAGFQKYKIEANPRDDRAKGFWANKIVETVIVNPMKLASLTTLVTLATEHYTKADITLSENLHKVISNPRKLKKLVEALQKLKELELPKLNKGDVLLAGKFKNKRCVITGFDTDANGQPVATTDRGTQQIFKPRIEKLMNPKAKVPEAAVEESTSPRKKVATKASSPHNR